MTTAFAWARVSSKEQEEAGNSVAEQLRRIRHLAGQRGIRIVKEFQAGESAFQGHRAEFEAMLEEALASRPDYILADDSSRFSRNREDAIRAKKALRGAGIRILFVNEPEVDPDSIAGIWLDGIQEIKNEVYSREIAFNTVRGMRANAAARDPETGSCYKNGGRVPFGYARRVLDRGWNRKGKPIRKIIWDLDPDRAPVVRLIIVDLYTGQRLSYERIRDYLNDRDIPCPTGGPWGTSTIVEMLRDNRLEQYAGRGFWNKEARGKNGHRFNDRSEWVIIEKAHPAIITPEELQNALARRGDGRTTWMYSRAKESPYLFTGVNYEGQPMFACASCGGNVIGYRNSRNNWRKYVCGVARNKGVRGCPHHLFVDVREIEDQVLAQIQSRYIAPDARGQAVAAILERLAEAPSQYRRDLDELERRGKDLVAQRTRLLDSIKAGIPANLIREEAERLSQAIDRNERDMRTLKESPPLSAEITAREVESFLGNFETVFAAGTPSERKRLIRTFVHRLELDPEKKEVRVSFYADPQVHSFGVRRGT